MRGIKRLAALFFTALILLGAVLLALPYFTLGGIERRLATRLRDQAQVVDFRLDQHDSLAHIYVKTPHCWGSARAPPTPPAPSATKSPENRRP